MDRRSDQRISPILGLGFCPNCHDPSSIAYDHHDPFFCASCFTAIDIWWTLDELCWNDTPDLSLVNGEDFDLMRTLVPYNSLTSKSNFCCDEEENNCLCSGENYIHPLHVDYVLKKYKIDPDKDIYNIDKDHFADCRSCENYLDWKCIPLRNWIRAFKKGKLPEGQKLDICYHFEEDSHWVNKYGVDLNEIHFMIAEFTNSHMKL